MRLLKPVMRDGEVLAGSLPPLSEIWELAQQNLAALPAQWAALRPEGPYPVVFSEGLQALRRQAAQESGGRLPDAPAPVEAVPPAADKE
jgi:nicotinate phosphoribosyltransferase